MSVTGIANSGMVQNVYATEKDTKKSVKEEKQEQAKKEQVMETSEKKDTFQLSEEARELLEKQREENLARWYQELKERYQDFAEKQRKSTKEAAKSGRTQGKCMRIAISLAAGDKVPIEDIEFLKKNAMELYLRAIMMRIPKENEKEKESVLDKSEKEEIRGGMQMPIVISGMSAEEE